MDPNSLQPIMNVLTTVAPILGMFGVVVGLGQYVWKRTAGYPSGGGAMIGGGLLLVASGFILPSLVGSLEVPADSGETNDKPPAEPSMPGIDWSLVGWIAVGVAGLVVALVLVLYISSRALRVRTLDAAERDRLDRIWKESVERHDRLRDAWLDFQHDIEKVLTFPLLSDVSEPKTAAFIDAMGKATDLATDRQSKSAEAVERYAQATRTAETKWQAALHHAERVRLARFEPGERDRIKKVSRLLRQAKSGGASPEERRTYYERARELLGDLIRLPEPARLALEQSVRGELEAPTPPSSWPGYSTPTTRVPEPSERSTSKPSSTRRGSDSAPSESSEQLAPWITYGLVTGADFSGGEFSDPGSGCS